MREISKIFILHYSKLTSRRSHIENEAQAWFGGKPYEFMTELDKEVLTEDIINESIDLEEFKFRFDRHMNMGEVSLCLKFKAILKKIVEEEDGELFMILEDDVVFKESPVNYVKKVEQVCHDQSIKYDCVFMGEALIRKGDNRDVFFKKDYPSTNGMCTVLYTREAIEKMHDYLSRNKISQPLDWEANDMFRDLGFNVYWGKAITIHGSVIAEYNSNFGHFKSSLRDHY